VARGRRHGRSLVLKLEGVENINQADLLRNLHLEMDVEDLEPLGENEFYVFQIIGLRAITEDGREIGRVTDMHEWGPYWTLEIRTPDGKELLVPFVEDYVPKVLPREGVLVLSLPPGYIEQF